MSPADTCGQEHRCPRPDCGFKNKRKGKLNEHVRTVHATVKRYKCSEAGCNYKSARKGNLSEHIKTHSAPQHACPRQGCSYKAKRRSHLKEHVLAVHEKVRRFPCKYSGCSFSGLRHSGLWCHLKDVHKEGPVIECDHQGCSYKSRLGGSVKTHVQLVHQKIQRFSCHICTYACWNKKDMRRHVKRHEAEGHDVSHCPRCQLLFQNRTLQSVKAMAASLAQDQEVEARGSLAKDTASTEEEACNGRNSLSDELFSVHSSLHLLS